uniref:Expansin n=1 Tax=Kalanchoe fedtschenkoi TaxID=63787 RepID=A0A7N0R9K4_KALFE
MKVPWFILLMTTLFLVVLPLPDHQVHASRSNIIAERGHLAPNTAKHHKPPFRPGPWKPAHATFYGGSDGSQTMGGACGYENLIEEGYGLQTAALSQQLFNGGQTCGACYEIKCVNDAQWCKPGQPSMLVTATNLCPPNGQLSSQNGGWCNPPLEHFDIAQPAFVQVAEYKAGIIPVQYRRIPCQKKGGIKFTITGNPYFNMVLVWNVGGAGDVTSLQVKGGKKLKWTQMDRNWGQKWTTGAMMQGERLTFRVTTSDGKTSTSWNIVPENWQFGQTFEGKNFK